MIFVAAAALGAEPARAWETLHDARLVEAVDGTPEVAALYYEELVGELTPGHPLYGTAWYWLGRTRWGLGDADGAVLALRNAQRDEAVRAQATALLGRIGLKQRAIRSLPALFVFDGGDTGAFVRDWDTVGGTELVARGVMGRTALAWETLVQAGEADHISAALEGGGRISAVRFLVRARAFPAELRVTVSDGAGARYSAPVIQVPTGEWLLVDLPAGDFRSTDGARDGGGNALRPSDPVRLLEIEDLSGLLSPGRGNNTLYLDDFEVR